MATVVQKLTSMQRPAMLRHLQTLSHEDLRLRFGTYMKDAALEQYVNRIDFTHDKVFGSFEKKTHTYEFEGETYNVLNITMDAAVELLRNTKKRAAPTPLKELGNHPDDEAAVQIFEGKFGPYVKHGSTNATVPKDTDISTVTMEEAVLWLAEKVAKGGGKKAGGRKATARKGTAKKTATKSVARKTTKKAGKKTPKKGA